MAISPDEVRLSRSIALETIIQEAEAEIDKKLLKLTTSLDIPFNSISTLCEIAKTWDTEMRIRVKEGIVYDYKQAGWDVEMDATFLGGCFRFSHAQNSDEKPAQPETGIGSKKYPDLHKDCNKPTLRKERIPPDGTVEYSDGKVEYFKYYDCVLQEPLVGEK